ncbi:MAG: hypothetical protein LW817_00210 [Candidatus Caenarcaniphilales bacterium]|jgi:hypothetical protein|nr:hypothetical protein [Candidatus Caenarcaniphilales bacterium]
MVSVASNQPLTNTTLAPKATATGAIAPQNIEDKEKLAELSRTQQSLLAAEQEIENPGLKSLNKVIGVASTASSFALKAAGMIGAALTAGIYFFTGFKLLALLTAIPSGMAFYIAHSLGQHASKSKELDLSDPIKIFEKAQTEPEYLEDRIDKLYNALDRVDDWNDKDSRHQTVQKLLESLKVSLNYKRTQLELPGMSKNVETESLAKKLNKLDALITRYFDRFKKEDI